MPSLEGWRQLCIYFALAVHTDSVLVVTARILEAPSSATAAEGKTAVFTCRANGVDAIDWLVEGRVASHQDIIERGFTYRTTPKNGHLDSTLNAAATVANNNTNVKCVAFSYASGPQFSKSAVLLVQGLLSCPGDFQVEEQDRNSIQLSWKSPFTLEGVRIKWITIYYEEVSTGDVTSLDLPGNSTTYSFSAVSNPDPCLRYRFNVSATNEVGESGHSDAIEANFLADPAPVNMNDVYSVLEFTEVVKTTLTFSFAGNSPCTGLTADHFIVNLTSQNKFRVELIPKVSKQHNLTILELDASHDVLPHNNIYRTVITSVNSIGSAVANGTIQTSTFDVQDASVVLEHPSGLLCLSCVFANGTTASGCVAAVEELGTVLTAMRQPDRLTANNCSDSLTSGGRYQVLVYDLESTGLLSDSPAAGNTVVVPETDHDDEEGFSLNGIWTKVALAAGGLVLCVILAILIVAVLFIRSKLKRSKQTTVGDDERVYDTILERPPPEQEDTHIHLMRNTAYERPPPKQGDTLNIHLMKNAYERPPPNPGDTLKIHLMKNTAYEHVHATRVGV